MTWEDGYDRDDRAKEFARGWWTLSQVSTRADIYKQKAHRRRAHFRRRTQIIVEVVVVEDNTSQVDRPDTTIRPDRDRRRRAGHGPSTSSTTTSRQILEWALGAVVS